MSHDVTLTELMGARFCHDLAGPISAVNNGLEFLREENEDMRIRALELIEASSRESVTRLQFFRQAYGMVPSEGETNIAHLKELTQNLFSLGKITLDWPDNHTQASGISMGHRMGRLALNLIIICASALIHGGTIHVRLEKTDGGYCLTTKGTGKDIKVSPDIAAILADKTPYPMDKRNVQVHFTLQLAKQLGVAVQLREESDALQLSVERMQAHNHESKITEGTAITSHV